MYVSGIFGVVPALPPFNLLYTSASESEEIYACHAAGIVAAANPNWLDELGDVRVEEMSMQWKAGHGTCLDHTVGTSEGESHALMGLLDF